MTIQYLMNSKVGKMYLVASDIGLQGIFWKKQNAPMVKSLEGKEAAIKTLVQTITQIEEYLTGKRKRFNLKLDIIGTEFQKRVWLELANIPYGQTRSYKEIAIKIKDENASRAVGTANGKNPLSLIFPCHRVIATSGKLAGYAGGLTIKANLLELEKKGVLPE